MIDDSRPWREELWRIARRLEGRKGQRRWTPRSSFLCERDTMLGAYAIRKLAEASKLSDEMLSETTHTHRYPLRGRVPDLMSRDRIDESYDLEDKTVVDLALIPLCNQFIHSFVWMIETDTGSNVSGIYFCSDRDRRRFIYRVGLEDLVGTYDAVVSDDIVEWAWHRRADGTLVRDRASRTHSCGQEDEQAW